MPTTNDTTVKGHVLHHWDPENPEFWERTGARIARRNLWISIISLTLSFAIWVLWSVVTVNLDKVGFRFTSNQLFWLTALPALSGATLRVFYSFMVPIFGGRRWTVISTLSLLLPAVGMGIALQDSSTSYSTLLIVPQGDDVDAHVLQIINLKQAVDIFDRPFDDLELEDLVPNSPASGPSEVIHPLGDDIEGDGDRRLRLVQVGDVVHEGPFVPCVDEAEARRAPQRDNDSVDDAVQGGVRG